MPIDETQESRDLGFGSFVARESRQRLLNRDGSFNVRRRGQALVDALSPYHTLLTTSWAKFLAIVVAVYVAINALFALLYFALGPAALIGPRTDGSASARFAQAFFFSVETFGTIGYGNIAPGRFAADVLVTIESISGLVAIALLTGLVFARFSRPQARIEFSRRAVIAPYRGGRAFEFRIVNPRRNELVQLEVQVSLATQPDPAKPRMFTPLTLERTHVTFFPLAWTIVHPIDEASPLADATLESLRAQRAEFLVLLTAFDETFSQTVHTRSSYIPDDIVWSAKFRSMFAPSDDDGIVSVDIGTLDTIEPAELAPVP